MAKAKKELAGNWELTSGGIFHKSWTGVTFRSRGSAGAYFEGCKFPRPPEQPPPPPPPPPPEQPPPAIVTWHVKVHARSWYEVDPGTGDIYMLLQIFFGVTKTNHGTGEVLHHTEVREYPGYQVHQLTLIRLAVSYSADAFSKNWRIILPDLEDTFTLSVPPFNQAQPLEANIDEQVHEV